MSVLAIGICFVEIACMDATSMISVMSTVSMVRLLCVSVGEFHKCDEYGCGVRVRFVWVRKASVVSMDVTCSVW